MSTLATPGALNLASLRASSRKTVLPVAIIMLVVLMVVPIPAAALDVFFIANITISLVVLMLALNSEKPLDFSSFPTVLLFTTLFRLALNVASTRVVLVHGHTGKHAAGQVIESFGDSIIGGNFIVGIFVFAILIIINLVVITKGAGRVSEVSARFTLDALPGKQMAVDADLNAGLLTQDEAKARRQEVSAEADFYGSMDGASKFVKGDAIAALLILVINIIGGLIVGVAKHQLTFGAAAETYVILAVGDALVAQIPSLMMSIAAASIVTRVSSTLDLTDQLTSQFSSASAWTPVAAILFLLGVLPGMPHMVILPTSAVAAWIAYRLRAKSGETVATGSVFSVDDAVRPHDADIVNWEDVFEDTVVGLELGFGLLGLIDEKQPAPLLGRLTAIRKQLSKDLGFVVPKIRVRDNLSLQPFGYRLVIGGGILGEDEVSPHELLALESGDILVKVAGRPVKDPTYGLDALWISTGIKQDAIAAGYTVVDPSTVIATHLNQLLQKNARSILGQDAVQKLLDALQLSAPLLVSNLVPKILSLQALTLILQNLLDEHLSLREFRTILEAIAAVAHRSQYPNELSELIRPAIGHLIVQRLFDLRETLKVITFDQELERLLLSSVRADPNGLYPFDPHLSERLTSSTRRAIDPLVASGTRFAIITSPIIRRQVFYLLRQHLPEPNVMSFYDVPDNRKIDVIAVIGRHEQ